MPSFLANVPREKYSNIQDIEKNRTMAVRQKASKNPIFWNRDNIIRSVRGGGGNQQSAGYGKGIGSANIYGSAASFLNPYARNEKAGFKMPYSAQKNMNVRVAETSLARYNREQVERQRCRRREEVDVPYG